MLSSVLNGNGLLRAGNCVVRKWHFHRAFAFGAGRVMLTGADRLNRFLGIYSATPVRLSSFRIVCSLFLRPVVFPPYTCSCVLACICSAPRHSLRSALHGGIACIAMCHLSLCWVVLLQQSSSLLETRHRHGHWLHCVHKWVDKSVKCEENT